MTEDERLAITQIQTNRALPVRRISNQRIVFQVREGKRIWYVCYNNKHKRIEDNLSEGDARFQAGNRVYWLVGGQLVHGMIAVVIPPQQRITSKLSVLLAAGYDISNVQAEVISRQQTSYLVSTGKVLHWPNPSKIRIAR